MFGGVVKSQESPCEQVPTAYVYNILAYHAFMHILTKYLRSHADENGVK